MIYASKAKK